MNRLVAGLVGLALSIVAATAAYAQGTVKIGLILPYSGQFADTATQMDNGDQALHEEVRRHRGRQEDRDHPQGHRRALAPDVAKRLAQELVVRDGVDILAGFVLTPNALAVSDVSDQAKKFMVIMNAATSIITTKSNVLRAHLGDAAPGDGDASAPGPTGAASGRSYTMVSDYGPGHDAEGGLPAGVQGGRGRDHRLGALAGGEPGFLGVRPARQGPEPGVDLHLRAGRRPAGGAREGDGRARHRRQEDEGPGDG